MIGSLILSAIKKTNLNSLNTKLTSCKISTISGQLMEHGLSSLSSNSNSGARCFLLQKFNQPALNVIQTRTNWGYKGRMMLKDIKRRELLKKYAPVRIRLQTLRANSVLPKIIKRETEDRLRKLVFGSALGYTNNRCAFTSKAGGCLHRWRLSRHVWRDLADYNQLSGVTRAVWGRPTLNAAHFTFSRQRKSWFNYDGYRDIEVINAQGKKVKMRFNLN